MADTAQLAPAGEAPTAPGRAPLLGHLLPLARGRIAMLQSLRSQGDVVKIYLGARPVYVVNAPELVHRILVTEKDTIARGRLFRKIRQYTGDGIATAEGEFHLRQRRLMRPAFHRERFRTYVEIMRDHAAALADSWQPAQPVAVEHVMGELASTIISQTLCRADVGVRAAAEIHRFIPVVEKGTMRRALSPIDLLERLPTPGNRRFDRARARLRQVINELIDVYLADPTDHGDLLSMLVSARDEQTGAGMSREQLGDHLITLLIAGTETTATVLAWLFHELGRNARLEARLHAEVDSTLSGRPVAFDNLPALEYTQRLVKETLRLHSPAWLSMRRTTTAIDLGGTRIPADADLVYSPATMHRDPNLYPDPMRFDPDRWLPERAASLPRNAFIPFGSGRYKCIGDHFSMTEATVVLATIAARWRLVPVRGHRVREIAETTLHPDGVPMTAVPRRA